ncbi:hypothetical protein CHL67_03715 [Prosthecochloris sp. GSB1]|uniref:hypothetical protein n=1 Tax=Prosthecochloris sp. GSB1 TaxID=281093 RepID=UPI000B8D0419|nr:hypothetical protein [Prosthecochloris sp. GSB1]ASQ90155.1 hypothetical protein CHL67_03715 [Prosthecochloris sp. GSB1]
MDQTNPAKLVTTGAGIAGGAALIAPVAPPILHGLAGIAVVGLGVVAAGTLVKKATDALQGSGKSVKSSPLSGKTR